MLTRIRRLISNNEGMTLPELIIVLGLIVLILGGVFLVINMVNSSNRMIGERIDAQSQFRLMTQVLRNELSTSENIELREGRDDDNNGIPDTVPETVASGYTCIYVCTDYSTGIGTFYKKTGSTPQAFTNPYPIQGLTLTFQTYTAADFNLKIIMTATDQNDFTTNIALQNVGTIEIPEPQLDNTYAVVIYKDPPTV